MSSTPIGDPRPAGQPGPAGDQRQAGEAGPSGDPRPAGEAATEQIAEPQFDPSEHTVTEVNDYLADADEAERGRVLAAERAGKDRASVG